MLGRGGSLETARERLASAGRGGGRSAAGPPHPGCGAGSGGRRPPPGRARAAPHLHPAGPAGGKRGIRGGEGTVGPPTPPLPPGGMQRVGAKPAVPHPHGHAWGVCNPPRRAPEPPPSQGLRVRPGVWGGRGCPLPASGPRSSSEARARLRTRHLSASPPGFRSPPWGPGRSGPGAGAGPGERAGGPGSPGAGPAVPGRRGWLAVPGGD